MAKFWHLTLRLFFVDGNSDWDLISQNAVNAVIMICYKSIEATNVMFSPSERTPLVDLVTHENRLLLPSLDIFRNST